MISLKTLYDRLKTFFNGGKYKNIDIINEVFADYIEWHHRKNGFPIFKKSESLKLLNEFFTERNMIIYDAQILHGSNHRKPRKEILIALSAAVVGILWSILEHL